MTPSRQRSSWYFGSLMRRTGWLALLLSLAGGCAALNALDPADDVPADADPPDDPPDDPPRDAGPMFARQESWHVSGALAMAVANADLDAEDELIVSTVDGKLLVLDGAGETELLVEPEPLARLFAVDIDGNGNVDLVGVSVSRNEIVFISDLPRRPLRVERAHLLAIFQLEDLAVGAADFDTTRDLALATTDGVVVVCPDQPESILPIRPSFAPPRGPTHSVQFMDVDGDGHDDLVVLQQTELRSSLYFVRRADDPEQVRYEEPVEIFGSDVASPDGPIRGMKVTEMDFEGRREIVVLTRNLHVLHFTAGTTEVTETALDPGLGALGFDLHDANNDGVPDAFLFADTELWVLPGARSGEFDLGAARRVEMGAQSGVAIGDLDEDSRPDMALIVAGGARDRVKVFLTRP